MKSIATSSALISLVACLLTRCAAAPGQLGSQCAVDRECGSVVAHSRCSLGHCACQPYYAKLNATRCLPSSLLGFSCQVKEQCSLKVANSSCIQSMCRCQPGFLQFRRHTCLSPARPTEVCYSDAHCRLWNIETHCDFLIPKLFGRCRCNRPLKQIGDSCLSPGEEPATSSTTEKYRPSVSTASDYVSTTQHPANTGNNYTSPSTTAHVSTVTTINSVNDISTTRGPSLITALLDAVSATITTTTTTEIHRPTTQFPPSPSTSVTPADVTEPVVTVSAENNDNRVSTTTAMSLVTELQDEVTSKPSTESYRPTTVPQSTTSSYASTEEQSSAVTEHNSASTTVESESEEHLSATSSPSISGEYVTSGITEASTIYDSTTEGATTKPTMTSTATEEVSAGSSFPSSDDYTPVSTGSSVAYFEDSASTSSPLDVTTETLESTFSTVNTIGLTTILPGSTANMDTPLSSSEASETTSELQTAPVEAVNEYELTTILSTVVSEPPQTSTLMQEVQNIFAISSADLVSSWPIPTQHFSSSVPPDVTLMTHLIWSPVSDMHSSESLPEILSSLAPLLEESSSTLEAQTQTSQSTESDLLAASTVLVTEPPRLRGEDGAGVSLGLPCVADAQCQATDSNSRCLQGRCDCARRDNGTNSCGAFNRGCHSSTFQCRASGACISWFFVCDGRRDCSDGSDEECRGPCPAHAFRCGLTGVCVSRAGRCDGVPDCPAGEDEAGCTTGRGRCPEYSFRCGDGACLPEYEFCNAVVSCADGSDEPRAACKARGRRQPTYCPFRCNNGRCRSSAIACSGRDGCGDRSDEARCSVCKCPAVH